MQVYVRAVVALTLILAACPLAAQVPSPEEVLGWPPGADHEAADYGQLQDYFRRLAEATGRVTLQEIGRSAKGRPMILLFISSEENLRELERWRSTAERLARARLVEAEARSLAGGGKAIVWIDGGLHGTEVAPAQLLPQLAFDLVTGEDAKTTSIRENVITLLVFANPDGMTIVSDWYMGNVGTPYETSPFCFIRSIALSVRPSVVSCRGWMLS